MDVEDWYHVCGVSKPAVACESRVTANVERLLQILRRYRARGTFFVLGSVAEQEPSLVPRIAAEGHEIASHGYSHTPVPELGPEAFREEIRRTGDILERQAGRKPVGFRAPQWSLSLTMPWAYTILAEEGYTYDSSMNPLPFVGDRRGSVAPFTVSTTAGKLLEVPPMVTPTPAVNLPTGGGWGFRFFPFFLIGGTIRSLNRRGLPANIYLHPRELDPAGPRLSLSPIRSFAAYGTRSDAAPRLERILQAFCFRTMNEVIRQCQLV